MKEIILIVLAMVFLMVSVSFAEVLPLKANWTPNTDTITIGYKLYRTDGTRTLVGTIPGKPTSTHNFNITVPDGSIAVLKFVMTAYSETKESVDSATATYNHDGTPVPDGVSNFMIQHQ